jgi:hypothetical protein
VGDLPTDIAATQGVTVVTSKAPGGKPVIIRTESAGSAPNRKVGSFSLSSVLISTTVGAGIVAALGGVGLYLTRRAGLSHATGPFAGSPR